MALSRVEVEATVRRFAERLRQSVPVDEVWVYGSYARGAATDDSDIDVAVVSPELGRNCWEDTKALAKAVLPDAILVEPMAFNSAHRESPPRGSLLREILRTGWRVV